jgi:hypothetical protein
MQICEKCGTRDGSIKNQNVTRRIKTYSRSKYLGFCIEINASADPAFQQSGSIVTVQKQAWLE